MGSEEWQKERQKCLDSLYYLAAKVLGFEEPVPMTLQAHYALCRFAERKTGIPAVDNSRVQLIQVCRGWGKTLCVTTSRTIQRSLANVNWAAGIMNERQDMAESFLGTIKSAFETNAFLRALFPERCPENTRDTVWKSDRIVLPGRTMANSINPSVLAAGALATVTGVHMNEWIVDDLLSEDAAENAMSGSFTEIEKLNRRVIQLQPLLTRPKQDPLTFIGTPWWPGDTYSFIEEVFGRGEQPTEYVWNLKLPNGSTQSIIIEQKGELAIFRLRPIENNVVIYPEKFDREMLTKWQEDDPVFFAAQALLKPVSGGVAAFKTSYLQRFDWELDQKQIRYRNSDNEMRYERVANTQCIMSVDPAISEKNKAARSAVVVTGSTGKEIFIYEAFAARCSPHDLAMKIIELYKIYKPTRIIIESVAYQMALADVLRLLEVKHNVGRLPIYEHPAGAGQRKPMRIAGLEPYFRRGLIYYNPPSQNDFFEEYTNFSPNIGNRLVDILDALSFQKTSWEELGFLAGEGAKGGSPDQWRTHNRNMAAKHRSAAGRVKEWKR